MSVKKSRSRYHEEMARRGLLVKLRGKQALQAQEELNRLWELTRQLGTPPDPIPGRFAVAALIQDGECQAEDPFAPFWGPIGKDGRLWYCCTHVPQPHWYPMG